MLNEMFFTVEDVSKIMKVSSQTAYRIIRQLNDELKAEGYITIAGRVPKKYFSEKMYC